MTPAEMGIVYNQLVNQRAIYSGKISNRRRSKEEIEAAEILDKARGDHADLDDFLETQGLILHQVDPFAIGLGMEGRIYIALRNPSVPAPSHLAPNDVIQELIDERRRSENKDSAAIWASFMLLTLFYFLYTLEGRSIESVSEFKDSAVDQEEFIEEVRKRIERMRNEGLPGAENDERATFVYSTLTDIRDTNLDARARSFFNAMVKLKVLEPTDYSVKASGGAVYRQSLWSAIDTAENFSRHIGPVQANGLISGGKLNDVLTTALPEQDGAASSEEGNA
ncbi:hypothetical protein EB809_18795 [Marinobacter sp. R17]|uniref:hypothetical protein n=1 Tax=Marinobacter sp. R17 TaxID=2484250 RepID=UPI000F4D153A|nr:hypothetical protein [Marinobacter sp. R17]ROT94726.1 hypothetical protein EB809_18795 [Marinobacter sp. R17]